MKSYRWIARLQVSASFGNRIPNSPGFIPTGSIGKQRGEVDWIVFVFFLASIQFWQLSLLQKAADSWSASYQALEDVSQKSFTNDEMNKEFKALGQDWPSPRSRIDYGANHQKERDAEALCIIGREKLLEEDFKKLRCE